MKPSFRNLLCVILLLVSCSLLSQQIKFNRVTSPIGSFSGLMGGIAQDKNGFMWFATTSGLFKFDGYRYKIYVNNPTDSNSLSSNHLETVYADSKGFIWVVTWVNGLDRLDPATGKFTHFKKGSLSHNLVRAILEDRDGMIWIGTLGGLDKYDPQTGEFQHFRNDTTDPNSLSCDRVRRIYEDRIGTLWIGTGSTWSDENGNTDEGGLNRFDRKTGKFTRYIYDPKDPDKLINNKVNAIFEDSKGIFWVGTSGDGLHTMDRASGKFIRHRHDPANPEKLSRPPVINNSGNVDNINFITEDALHNIWIGTHANGISKYDPQTQKVAHYISGNNDAGFMSNSAWCYCNSAEGNLWLGTEAGGLYRVDPLRKSVQHINTSSRVWPFNTDSANNLWIGTANGLILQSGQTGISKKFLQNDNDRASLSNNYVYSLFRDDAGTLWVGTENGLNRFNEKSNNFVRYIHDPGNSKSITPGNLHAFAEAGRDSLWIGTGNGLELMIRSNGSFTHFKNEPNDSTSMQSNFISALLVEPSGNLWLGYYGNGGVDYYDHSTGHFKHVLKTRGISSLLRDASGNIWVGADDGLYKATPNLTLIKYVNPADNIDFSGVLSMQLDNRGVLWIGCGLGIVSLDPVSNQTTVYGQNHDVNAGGLSLTSSYKGKDGRIYFGEVNGYYIISPGEFVNNSIPPRIVLTGFNIRGKSVVPGNKTLPASAIHEAEEIFLGHNENVFSFDFAGIHYSDPANNKHMYKLENYDQDWHGAGTEKTASYYNVPPGRYIFRIKAANSDGLWAERTISIIISPPWWKTWWAYSGYGLLIMTIAVSFHRYQKARVIKSERERTKERELAQAREIEKAYHELKTTQSQLVQQEKMASLGELTAGIAHEIQNPLNFVNNFSEVNSELITEMKQEIDKGNFNEVRSIADSIDENEQKIIFHGKRADVIVKGMLQHSRASSGQKEPTDINALAEEYLRLAYHGLRAKDKSFNAITKTEFDISIGKINVVPQDLGRVILNLINNAFYAVNEKQKQNLNARPDAPRLNDSVSQAGGRGYEPIVTVGTAMRNGRVEIKVKDNGNGIPQKVLDKIFQPFFTTKPTGEGTGLGLSLAYDIVTKGHAGEMKVETKEGEGTTFIIILPSV